jgi:hypothetical protein
LLNGALMIVRRTLEGALKCALRDFRREEWRAAEGPGRSVMLFESFKPPEKALTMPR